MKRFVLITVAVSLSAAQLADVQICSRSNFTRSEIQEILYILNRNRSANNTADLSWDCELANYAADNLGACAWPNLNLSLRNLYRVDYDDPETIETILQRNLDLQNYNTGPYQSSYSSRLRSAELLMSPKATKIGCDTKRCYGYHGYKVAALCITDEPAYAIPTNTTTTTTTTTVTVLEEERIETTTITSHSRHSSDATYCSGGSLTEDEINCQILSMINHKRFELASGMQWNGWYTTDTERLPPAKNMNKLAWSCDLERKASAALEELTCSVWDAPNSGHGYAFYSEYDYWFEISDVIRQVVSMIDYQNFTSVSYDGVTYLGSSSGTDESVLKGYANLMRPTATKIGCASKSCDDGFPIINLYCITDQPDIEEGDKVYEAGSGICDCTNFCDPTGLCTVSRPAPTCIEAIFPKPTNEDPDTICAHGDMTDALRILMMDMHNIRRAQLARGQLKYSGNMLPSATNMNRLVWSCALEKEAHDHLAKCPTEGYKDPTCLSPVDNFYRAAITSDSSIFKEMTKRTIRIWWDVYQNYPNPGFSAFFNESLVGTPVESYTRMGWAQTREIGCSIAKCGDEYVLTCRYRPNGNIVNNPMYNVGLVCSECYIFGAGSCGSGGLCG